MPQVHARVLAVALAAMGCRHTEPRSTASQGSVSVPTSPKNPYDPSGWRTPAAAVVGERNRCVDRELGRRELNEFGDPQGTQYANGRPLEVSAGMDRYQYVMRNHPEIRVMCSAAPGEPTR